MIRVPLRSLKFCYGLIFVSSVLAQNSAEDSLLSHYPLKVGNIWDYSGGSFPSLRLVTATKDSIHPNGKKYTVLYSVTYDISSSDNVGSLGQVRKETILQRVDSTSLNVYRIPYEEPDFGEVLIDSLRALPGDFIISNYFKKIYMDSFSEKMFFGKSRVFRKLVIDYIVYFEFETAEGLGEIHWSSVGEDLVSYDSLQAAVIRGDTLGALLRVRRPKLSLDRSELLFSKNQTKERIFFINRNDGLTVIDSVAMNRESDFYSQPFYRGAGYLDTVFSKGPFLVFPRDSIYLDMFIRESGLEQAFHDTLRVYARGINGESLPRIDIPVKVDPLVSVPSLPNDNQNVPDSFNLTAYPNPLHSQQTLKIFYQLNQTENLKIEVYDILGRRVSTLGNQRTLPGQHQIAWDSRDLPSGVYFVSLFARNRRETIRFQILK